MIFTMNKTDLQEAVSSPTRIAAKSLVAYTSCVLAVVNADSVTFEATDQNESARCSQPAFVEEQGSTLIPANSLASIIKTLPDQAVTIESDGCTVRIECGKASFELPALSPDDFPGFPTVSSENFVTMPFDMFASMSKAATPFVAKKNANRESLKGVYVEYDGRKLSMTATDSYHIVRIEKRSDEVSGSSEFSAIIPASFMVAASSLKSASEAMISASDNQVQITCGNTTLITRTINEQYPVTDRFFACEQNAKAEFRRADLMSATKRAVAVSSTDHMTVKISDPGAEITLSSQDKGSMRECFEVVTDGMCVASFTPLFLLDSLSAIDSESVTMILENPLKPILLKSDSVTCVIMPVRSNHG